jgi:hypothetical protein
MSGNIVNLSEHRAASEQHTLGFLIAVEVIAARALSSEVPGVVPDPNLDLLIVSARMWKARELQRTGGQS